MTANGYAVSFKSDEDVLRINNFVTILKLTALHTLKSEFYDV